MSNSSSAVDYSRVRVRIRVPRYDNNLHNRRDAARFFGMGYRVTDDYGRDLTIETAADGTRRVVVGAEALAEHNERIARAAELSRAGRDESGRPVVLPAREPTDYEAGRKHPEDCSILNCDHPLHFGGDEYCE